MPSLPLAMVALDDGSTISADFVGRDSRSALTKRSPDGSAIDAFGKGGSVLVPLIRGKRFQVQHLALQGGSVIAVGGGQGNTARTYVQRFDSTSGVRDPGFGINGATTLTLDDFVASDDDDSYPYGVGVDDAGRIYVYFGSGFWQSPDLLVRLTPNGGVDGTFGESGAVEVERNGCFPLDHLAVTDDGVFAYSHDCIRGFTETGDVKFDYRKQSDPMDRNIDLILGSPDGTTYVSISSGDDPDTIRILELDAAGNVGPAFANGGLVPTFPGQPEILLGGLSVDAAGRFLLVGKPDRGPNGDREDHTQEVVRLTADGQADASFGGDGMVVYDPPVQYRTEVPTFPKVTVVPDGLVLTGSRSSNSFPYLLGTAVKVRNDGTRDLTFGNDGLLRFAASVPADDRIYDTLAVTGGGTITSGSTESLPTFSRFKRNGKLDRSFGDDGRLTLPFIADDYRNGAKYLAEMKNGDFVACVRQGRTVQVARFDSDGGLVAGFGSGGVAPVPGVKECGGVAAGTAGQIVVVGTDYETDGYAAYRLRGDGTVDQRFGEGGRITGPRNSRGRAKYALTIVPNGDILIASPGLLEKFDSDGRPVKHFGHAGAVELSRRGGSGIRSVATIDTGPKGAIFVAGDTGRRPFLIKLNRKGKPSPGFGKRGFQIFKNHGLSVKTTDMKLQRGGRMVFSSTATVRHCGDGCLSVRVYRLEANGTLDRSFGRKGITEPAFEGNSEVNSISLSKGGILVGGFTETSAGRNDAMLFRLKR
ncbi:MAG: hypothetical protein ACSLFD_09100 [Solirubrobacterales bacterium]